jgi:hypothetical protein
MRSLYLVLSPGSLSYARYAIESLLARSIEPVHLHLITDTDADREKLKTFMESVPQTGKHQWSVFSEQDLAERESERFANYPNLRAFRRGHPCWRKITDPLLLAEPGAEMVLLDPDLYFPNDFTFEETPSKGILLMWQKPNCLLPHETVQAAMNAGVRLANHVDIGVLQWRGPDDLGWLDWFVGKIGGASLPRVMHIEAIVWAALAMKMGGGYLDPVAWHCWHRTQSKRVMRLLKVKGTRILRVEPWKRIKCFHGGGEAKHWIPDAVREKFFTSVEDRTHATSPLPFIELTPSDYVREQSIKRLLRGLGYYTLFRTA